MKGSAIYFILFSTICTIFISYLAWKAAAILFPLYRKRRLKQVYWTVNLVLLLGVALGRGRLDALPFTGFIVQCIVIWFMGLVISLLLFPLYFIIKKSWLTFLGNELPVDETRRKLLKTAAVSLPAISLGVGAYGVFDGGSTIQSLRHTIIIDHLDRQLNGFKIAQISDAHIGMFFSVEKLREILDRLRAEKPDVLVITGDLIDDVSAVDQTVAILDSFAAAFPKGIYFCWGNHEYFRDFPRIERALAHSSVHVLKNQSALLAEADKPLYLLGVDYPWAEHADEQVSLCRRMLDEAMRQVPQQATKVLLSHHPALIDQAYESGIDLTLTGHTHGGQFAILGYSVLPVRYKYMRGMYRDGGKYGYVSTGAGSWFPFRLGCPAEVAVFTLQRA